MHLCLLGVSPLLLLPVGYVFFLPLPVHPCLLGMCALWSLPVGCPHSFIFTCWVPVSACWVSLFICLCMLGAGLCWLGVLLYLLLCLSLPVGHLSASQQLGWHVDPQGE